MSPPVGSVVAVSPVKDAAAGVSAPMVTLSAVPPSAFRAVMFPVPMLAVVEVRVVTVPAVAVKVATS